MAYLCRNSYNAFKLHPSLKAQTTKKTWDTGEKFLADFSFILSSYRSSLICIRAYIHIGACTQKLVAYSFHIKP